jgi:hypothetical protein
MLQKFSKKFRNFEISKIYKCENLKLRNSPYFKIFVISKFSFFQKFQNFEIFANFRFSSLLFRKFWKLHVFKIQQGCARAELAVPKLDTSWPRCVLALPMGCAGHGLALP